MAKKRRVKISFDFYEVDDSNSNIEFKEVLDRLSTIPLQDRNILIDDEDIRIDEFDVDVGSGHYRASFIKLRPLEKVNTYKLDGKGREIKLQDDEYVGEEVSMYYDPGLRVLVLQSNKYGVSVNGIREYFTNFLKSDSIKLLPMYTLDTYKKLLKHKVITQIETRISLPSIDILNGEVEGWAFGDVKKLKDQLGAMRIGLILTVEDSRKSKLDFKTALQLVKELMKNKNIDKLRTKVRKTPTSALDEINIFEDLVRMSFFRYLEQGKAFTVGAMQRLAEEAYNSKKEEVVQLLNSKREII